ncbi:MAG: SRPBCC family protein [Pseudonocardia sp.]
MIDGVVVVHELVLAAPRSAVFAMFVDPAQLVRWIGMSAELEPRPGGRFRFEISPGQFCEGSYLEVDPPSRLSFSWGWTEPTMGLPPGSSVVEVELTELAGQQTHLRLCHRGLPADRLEMHSDGWTHFLAQLSAVADTVGQESR